MKVYQSGHSEGKEEIEEKLKLEKQTNWNFRIKNKFWNKKFNEFISILEITEELLVSKTRK